MWFYLCGLWMETKENESQFGIFHEKNRNHSADFYLILIQFYTASGFIISLISKVVLKLPFPLWPSLIFQLKSNSPYSPVMPPSFLTGLLLDAHYTFKISRYSWMHSFLFVCFSSSRNSEFQKKKSENPDFCPHQPLVWDLMRKNLENAEGLLPLTFSFNVFKNESGGKALSVVGMNAACMVWCK